MLTKVCLVTLPSNHVPKNIFVICKIFEITRTIHSSRERSEQFLVTQCKFIISNESEKSEFKLEKILGFRIMQEKLEKVESLLFIARFLFCAEC